MIQPTQQRLLDTRAELCERSPDVRFGQLLSHLGFLAEDQGNPGLWDVEDVQLLAVMESHFDELSRRQLKTELGDVADRGGGSSSNRVERLVTGHPGG